MATQGISNARSQGRKCTCALLPAPSRARKGFFASIWHSTHKFGCPFYFHEENSIFERRLKFSTPLFGTSVHFCLKSIRKAGGYTIFPCLAFCPIVDDRKLPAFQLVDKVRGDLWEHRDTSNVFQHLFRKLINQLRSVYEEGSASPRDITAWGGNILHVSEEIETAQYSSIALTNAIGSSVNPRISSPGDDAGFP